MAVAGAGAGAEIKDKEGAGAGINNFGSATLLNTVELPFFHILQYGFLCMSSPLSLTLIPSHPRP